MSRVSFQADRAEARLHCPSESSNGGSEIPDRYVLILRKEVIQPQVPLRLPCYDFTPVADLTVVG